MKAVIQTLQARQSLSRSEMQNLMSHWLTAPIEQQAAVLVLLSAKGETVEEILGARAALMPVAVTSQSDVIDIVGTGGDGKGVFNVSTAASLLVASCGIRVAKHGGRAATSQSGSMDVVEQLKLPICQTLDEAALGLQHHHYAYLWAPIFNPLFKPFAALRKHLGVPTLFNILGPLMNPLQPKRHLIGVYRRSLVRVVAEVLQQLGSVHAWVVHSEDGLDELSVSSVTYVAELKEGVITESEVAPEDAGLSRASLHSVLGGTAAENAQVVEGILLGEVSGPKLDIVLLNAAAGLVVAGQVANLADGVEMAREAIVSGKAGAWLEKLRSKSTDL
ncbi:MAG: anthranilate phosphoribosyltransferase [Gammaproteobacteria bacterium]|nr:anthranilate phosphoribosyltransferase [Gammaproteobacteria bacterium]